MEGFPRGEASVEVNIVKKLPSSLKFVDITGRAELEEVHGTLLLSYLIRCNWCRRIRSCSGRLEIIWWRIWLWWSKRRWCNSTCSWKRAEIILIWFGIEYSDPSDFCWQKKMYLKRYAKSGVIACLLISTLQVFPLKVVLFAPSAKI